MCSTTSPSETGRRSNSGYGRAWADTQYDRALDKLEALAGERRRPRVLRLLYGHRLPGGVIPPVRPFGEVGARSGDFHTGEVGLRALKIWPNQALNRKPSNGLEPLTPSLPWTSTAATRPPPRDKPAKSSQAPEVA